MRRSFKLLLAAVAMLALMCSGAWAEDINNGNKPTAWSTAGSPYTLTESVTISERITVTGEVRLILNDGCVLSADKGINVAEGNSFTIEGGTAGTGKLTARLGSSGENAAIGGDRLQAGGKITIKGGIVEAESGGGAGIGGGYRGAGGDITIDGGTVTASSSLGGAGIGGGQSGDGGDITIDGGTVTASSYNGAGIGGGEFGSGGNIVINGGTVTAEATSTLEEGSAGIGGGYGGAGGSIIINGGRVKASSKLASGIGRGMLRRSQEDDDVDHGTLSSDPNGSACITASSVGANTDTFNGVIFDESSDGNGKVYGNATVSGDVVISADKTLEVPDGATLTVNPGASLTVEDGAKLNVASGATFDASKGTLDNKGTVENDGIVKLPANTDISGLGMTGSGTVEMDGKTYDNTGKDTTPSPTPTPDPDPTPTPDQTHDPEQGKHTSAIIADETDSLWNAHAGQDLTIHIDVDLAKFDNSVSLDGVPLTQDTASVSHDFGAREGSTIVTIWEKTLKEHIKTDGEHTAEVGFKDGTAIHTFTVRGTGEAGETKHSSGGACTAGAAAFVAIAALAVIKRSKK